MSIPMIKALSSLGEVDLLIGTTSDDGGAFDVAKHMKASGIINHIYFDSAIDGDHDIYDFAIMSIPFDGRWRNGHHFNAHVVLDGRTRPDPSTTGLVSWKKHEVEYQMENAYELGYEGSIPDMSFYPRKGRNGNGDVYLGVGYKKDKNRFWEQKHWGNANFVDFTNAMLCDNKRLVISTGDILDWNMSLHTIQEAVSNPLFCAAITKLDRAFDELDRCDLYVGNDTGIMHVAASMGIPCISVFYLQNSYIKNHPWEVKHFVADGVLLKSERIFPIVLEKAEEFLNEKS